MAKLDPDLSFGEFDAVSLERWRAAAEKALGASLESVGSSVAGEVIPPLFADADDDRPPRARALWGAAGWRVGQELEALGTAEVGRLLEEARGGLEVAWVRVAAARRAGCRVEGGPPGLSGVGENVGALAAAAGSAGIDLVLQADAAAPLLLRAWCDASPDANGLAGVVADPLGSLAELGARGSSLHDAYEGLAASTRLAIERGPSSAGRPIATVLADAVPYHDAGATPSAALGAALAAALAHLQGLAAHGLSAAEVAPHLVLRLALRAELLPTIALLRAARLVWGACLRGLGAAAEPRIWARTSWRDQSRLDLPVNLLRNTLQAVAAAVGGVEHLYVQPHTEASAPSDADARRWARNVQHLLRGESRLDLVADPSAGSPYLEHLTRTIAAAAWGTARDLSAPDAEAALVAALHDDTSDLRRVVDAGGARVGVNLYPDPHPPAPAPGPEPHPSTDGGPPVVTARALDRARLAAAWESARDRAAAWASQRSGDAARVSIAPDALTPLRDAARRLAGLLGFTLVDDGTATTIRILAAPDAEPVVSVGDTEVALSFVLAPDGSGLAALLDRLEAHA